MDYKKLNDNELIYMVQENDENSTNLLLKKYTPIIHNLSYEYYRRFIGSGYEFEDFYQEALVSFYKALYTYNNSKNVLFYTFVIICMKRSLSGFVRKIYNSVCNNLDTIEISEVEYCVEDIKENPKVRDSFNGLEKIIKDVIFNLSIEAGAILELKINGFTYKEISKLLDIPMSSVEFKSRRARNILRSKVKAYYCK
ncbi:MAG: sigma-70 family RNA polymerase sigma factor [Bacilli bacterium]|nr:sigma-70 family RNA polymerase sigma factor [Bacilli bacterium]